MVDTLGWRENLVLSHPQQTQSFSLNTMQFVLPVSPLILDECIYQMTQYQAMGILMS